MASALNSRLELSTCPSAPALTRRYSSIALWGSIEIVNRPGASSTSWKGSTSWAKLSGTRDWAASSATIVLSPRRAATSPSAVATVDLPTPPLPVTNRSRLSRRAGTGGET